MSVNHKTAIAMQTRFGCRSAAEPRVPPCSSAEMRLAPRKEVVGHGFVRVHGYRLNVPCRIVNMSATGALLELTDADADHLPDRIIVAFAGERTEIDAHIQWRMGQECGVHFVSLFRKMESRPEPC
ncbi:MAG: PilZ domain-containing protein [Hyphomicrobiaceae bacterium]